MKGILFLKSEYIDKANFYYLFGSAARQLQTRQLTFGESLFTFALPPPLKTGRMECFFGTLVRGICLPLV